MPKTCLDCGATEYQTDFYPTSPYCTACHNRRMVSDRQKPHRRPKVNDYNNRWLKDHPKANREAQRRFRERQRDQREPRIIPPDRMTVQETMVRLGLRSRFRVTQLIDQGRLRATKERHQWLVLREDVELLLGERESLQSTEEE